MEKLKLGIWCVVLSKFHAGVEMGMISGNLRTCFACNQGRMIKIDPSVRHSYDYNTEGVLPHYCNHHKCGITSDSYEAFILIRRIFRKKVSNRNLKKILWNICTDAEGLRQELFDELRDDNKIDSIPELATTIYLKCNKKGFQVSRDMVLTDINLVVG